MSKVITTALKEYGVSEIQGQLHNKRVLQYFKEIGHKWVKDDETAWCSAFANWVVLKSGFKNSGKLTARSWLQVGKKITTPKVGDVVVFWRESRTSWKGHVGFFINYSSDKKWIYCLGGNQNNKVNIKAYRADRLLGFRELEIDWEMK